MNFICIDIQRTWACQMDGNPDFRAAGQRLRKVRQMRGHPDASDAARAMGIPVPTYQSHENGLRNMIKNAQAYARFFQVSTEWLLYGSDHELEPYHTGGLRPTGSNQLAKIKAPLGAGLWIDEALWRPPQSLEVPASPAFSHLKQVAFRLQTSPSEAVPEFAICVPYAEVRTGLRDGDIVIWETRMEQGLVERIMRRIRLDRGRAYLDSVCASLPPIELSEAQAAPAGVAYLVVGYWRPVIPA